MRCGARIKLKDFTDPDENGFLMNEKRQETKNPCQPRADRGIRLKIEAIR